MNRKENFEFNEGRLFHLNKNNNIKTSDVERRMILLGVVSVVAIIMILFGSFVLSVSKVNASEICNRQKYYTSVKVSEGDTLWNYALQYRTDKDMSIDDYICEVEQINHITKSQEIHAGEYILIPYFAEETI